MIEAFEDTSNASLNKALDETRVSLLFKEEPKYVLKFIRLNPGISTTNFVCCMIYYMITIFSMATPGLLQPLILLDKNYYNISQDNAGTVTSLVLIIQLAVKIIVAVPYGHLADKVGRKPVIVFSAINYLVSCFLVPFQSSIFPGFILAKAIFSNACTGLSAIPLLADYISDESKGKAVGFTAMLLGLAALISNLFLKALFYAGVSLGTCYIINGSIVFAVLLLTCLGLKGGKYYHGNTHADLPEEQRPSIRENLRSAVEIFKQNGWLLVALVLQVLGSSDFMVFFTFMTLYIKSLFAATTDDETENIVVNNLQTVVLVTSFVCNVFYGYFLDKKNKVVGMSIFALLGGASAFVFLASAHDPYAWNLVVGAIVLGATIPGLFVISTYLGIKNFPADKRGIMLSLMGIAGYFGYFILTSGGGFLYDHWRKDGPFIVCIIILVVASMMVLIIKKKVIDKQIVAAEVINENAEIGEEESQ